MINPSPANSTITPNAVMSTEPGETRAMNSTTEGSNVSPDDLGAPESWEAADVEESMRRLFLSSSTSSASELDLDALVSVSTDLEGSPSNGVSDKVESLYEDAINQVDQFLREALQNPRERLSILRMEQDVVKFIKDPTQLQLEFQQLPTSYLRLAAHRVAQHYFLQSMILVDDNAPDGSVTKIIVRKTSDECRFPRIRLADFPINLPKEEGGVVKLAIKQRPQKHSHAVSNNGLNSAKTSQSKSVEERKEEYNRARARIFSSSVHASTSDTNPENESRHDSLNHAYVGRPRIEEERVPGDAILDTSRVVTDNTPSRSSRSAGSRIGREPVSSYKPNNRVAIFRDREVESKDPDFDRNYDRYTQRFDPGFGFNPGPYTIQPMYAPAINYNTEFPQLGTPRPQVAAQHQPHPVAHHLPTPWASPSNIAGFGYGHPDTMMAMYTPNHVSATSSPAMYMQSSQYPGQHPGMNFIHSHEYIHQPFSQWAGKVCRHEDRGLKVRLVEQPFLCPSLGLKRNASLYLVWRKLTSLRICNRPDDDEGTMEKQKSNWITYAHTLNGKVVRMQRDVEKFISLLGISWRVSGIA